MNFEEIKNEFDKDDDIFKLKEVKYIREHKDEMIDQLLQVIEDYTNNIDIDNDIPISVLYSLFLLSEFREQRLFPYLIKMLHYKDPKYDFFDIYGEGICENFPEFLASTFNGDIESINNVIESDETTDDAKEYAISMYSYFLYKGIKERNEVVTYLEKNINYILELAEKKVYSDYFVLGILQIILDNHLEELLDIVKKLYENDLVDYFMYGSYEDYSRLVKDKEKKHRHGSFVITDTVKEFSSWAMFKKQNDKQKPKKSKSNKRKKQPKTNYKNKKKKKK